MGRERRDAVVLTAILVVAAALRQRYFLGVVGPDNLDYATIAEALSISSGTVGATLTTGRSALGKALEVEEATP